METASTEETIATLLDAIEQDRLVVLCGAGLSMAAPSNIPSAAHMANAIKDKCESLGLIIPENIEEQAEKFLDDGNFASYFIDRIIQRDTFASKFNLGHVAIADFLLSRAIFSAVSTNVDILIENAGQDLCGQIDGILDGATAAQCSSDRSPLLKIHGCWHIDRHNTIWTPKQLEVDPVLDRITKSKNWLELNLGNKELLVIGFWSDWSYLNSVLSEALGDVHPASVVIVDPSDTASLQSKAPDLCLIGEKNGVSFKHICESGDIFLDELRKSFSRRFFRKAMFAAKQAYIDETGNEPEEAWFDVPGLDGESLYEMRKDIEGRKPSECARNKNPDEQNAFVGLTILQLRAKGASVCGPYWKLDGKKIRVLKAEKPLHQIEEIHRWHTPPFGAAEIVICVGAEASSLPINIVRPSKGDNVVRGGSIGEWYTRPQACEELNL
jgi:hypothetical protein